MTPEQLYPLPGRAFIGMEPEYSDFMGGVAIPTSAIGRTHGRIGQVCSVTLYPVNKNSWVFKRGKLHSMPAYRDNDLYAELLSEYVVCRNATLVYGMIYEVRLEHVMSIVPKEAIPEKDALKRCKRCRSKGEANIILGSDGYCPVCGFNELGRHISQDCVIVPTEFGDLQITSEGVGEEEIDEFVRKPAEVDHVLRTGGKAIKGRVISYAGQKHRGTVEKAFDAELNKFFRRRK